MEHCGVGLDVTNSLAEAADTTATEEAAFQLQLQLQHEEEVDVEAASLPTTAQNVVKQQQQHHSEEEEAGNDTLMERAPPLLSISSWICSKRSFTQDDPSVDSDTFASESGLDSDTHEAMLEVQFEREAAASAAQVIGRFMLGGAVARRRSEMARLNRGLSGDKAAPLNHEPQGDEIINSALLNEGYGTQQIGTTHRCKLTSHAMKYLI